jgi:hypothetical protein
VESNSLIINKKTILTVVVLGTVEIAKMLVNRQLYSTRQVAPAGAGRNVSETFGRKLKQWRPGGSGERSAPVMELLTKKGSA